MAFGDPFLLGPLGAMVELPSLPQEEDHDANYDRISSTHTSLRGGSTVDVFGLKREWTLQWTHRERQQAETLIALWSTLTTRQLRLLDPLTRNLASADAAAGGAVSGSASAFSASDGDLDQTTITGLPGDLGALLGGAITWNIPEDTGATLFADTDLLTPLLDRDVALSLYARGEGDASAALQVYDEDFDATAVVDGSTVELDPDEWTELTVTLSPSSGQHYVAAGLDVPSGGERTVAVTAIHLEYAETPQAWGPGGGCPPVVVTEFSHTYLVLGRRGIKLTVREA